MDFSNTYVAVAPAASDIYHVEVIGLEASQTKAGNDRMRISLRVIEGAQTGHDFEDCVIRTGLNRANSGDSKRDAMMMDFWMKALMSLGYEQAELRERGEFDYDAITKKGAFENFTGRKGYLKFVPADPENGRQWSRDNWVTANQYQAACSAKEELASATAGSDDPLSKMLNG